MQSKKISKKNGFTLIEVMLAMVLISIAVLAIGSGEVTLLTLNKRTSEGMKARAASEYMIELMRRNNGNLQAYNGLVTQATSTPLFANPVSIAQFDANDWQRQVGNPTSLGSVARDAVGTITVTPGALPGMNNVQVIINWQFDIQNPPVPGRTVTFNTLIACNRGIC